MKDLGWWEEEEREREIKEREVFTLIKSLRHYCLLSPFLRPKLPTTAMISIVHGFSVISVAFQQNFILFFIDCWILPPGFKL